MKTSLWMSAMVIAVLAAVGCKDEENTAAKAAKPEAAKPAEPPSKTPEPTPPEVTPPTETPPTETPPAPPTDGIEGVGPFESIAAYCKDAKSKFDREDCKSMLDEGADMCSCGTGKGRIGGKAKIGPLPEATSLASAQLLLVERSAAGPGECDLAIETANDRGWLVVPALMPCTNAPMAHDDDTSIEVHSFDVTREDEVDVLTLAWTETSVSEDVESGKEHRTETKYSTRCTVPATTLPRCDKPVQQ
jgi:hypothetical protein